MFEQNVALVRRDPSLEQSLSTIAVERRNHQRQDNYVTISVAVVPGRSSEREKERERERETERDREREREREIER
jgi:hypothetical protein